VWADNGHGWIGATSSALSTWSCFVQLRKALGMKPSLLLERKVIEFGKIKAVALVLCFIYFI
jgi:hypothetical protein